MPIYGAVLPKTFPWGKVDCPKDKTDEGLTSAHNPHYIQNGLLLLWPKTPPSFQQFFLLG